MAKGGAGKMVAGCSGCLVLVFLASTVVLSFLPAMTNGRVSPSEIGYPFTMYGSSGCCCLAGVGMVVGIIMLVMGGKGGEDE